MPSLRPAARADFPAIRALIRRVGINPFGLDWRRFIVAIDENNRVIGCGQVKAHGDGSRELASIAVQPEFQGQGVGRAVVERLLEKTPLPLYLYCAAHNEPYYWQFGFYAVPQADMPPYFRRIKRLADFARRIFLTIEELKVMAKEGKDPAMR